VYLPTQADTNIKGQMNTIALKTGRVLEQLEIFNRQKKSKGRGVSEQMEFSVDIPVEEEIEVNKLKFK